MPAGGVLRVRRRPGRGDGDGAAPPPGYRRRPSAGAEVTEYVAEAGSARAAGRSPPGSCPRMCGRRPVSGRNLRAGREPVSGHHIPVHRATLLLCQLAGIAVSTGWMAGIRGKAAGLVEASGFTGRVRDLLKTAAAVHADETPARAAGGPGMCTWPAPGT